MQSCIDNQPKGQTMPSNTDTDMRASLHQHPVTQKTDVEKLETVITELTTLVPRLSEPYRAIHHRVLDVVVISDSEHQRQKIIP